MYFSSWIIAIAVSCCSCLSRTIAIAAAGIIVMMCFAAASAAAYVAVAACLNIIAVHIRIATPVSAYWVINKQFLAFEFSLFVNCIAINAETAVITTWFKKYLFICNFIYFFFDELAALRGLSCHALYVALELQSALIPYNCGLACHMMSTISTVATSVAFSARQNHLQFYIYTHTANQHFELFDVET